MRRVKMEQVVASVVTAIVVALITLWLPEANEKAAEAGIPIRCVVVDAGSTAVFYHDAVGSDLPRDVTQGD